MSTPFPKEFDRDVVAIARHGEQSRRSVGIALTVLTTALVACTSGTPPDHAAPPAPGAPGCTPASPITAAVPGPEIQGTPHGASLYGLIMAADPPPLRVDRPVKIVWRMTGSGPLELTASDPDGRPVALEWGPESHAGSNYSRPGDEWGAGYRFTSPGCWHLDARRGAASADVWLVVDT